MQFVDGVFIKSFIHFCLTEKPWNIFLYFDKKLPYHDPWSRKSTGLKGKKYLQTNFPENVLSDFFVLIEIRV